MPLSRILSQVLTSALGPLQPKVAPKQSGSFLRNTGCTGDVVGESFDEMLTTNASIQFSYRSLGV
jgi:hypothetical protein